MEIPLTQGKIALIDDEDWPLVAGYKWCAFAHRSTFYATNRTHVVMGRVILSAALHQQVGYVNGDGLDNRRANLRFVSRAQLNAYRPRQRNNTSGFKGVDFVCGKWRARLRTEGKSISLGMFRSSVAAALAYDAAARELYGEFARLNFP